MTEKDLENCSNPHTKIGSHNMHQAKTSQAFELVNVKLQKQNFNDFIISFNGNKHI